MPTNSKTYLQRLSALHVSKLEKLPIFDQIVHKLVSGQSPITVATWCFEQKVPGEIVGLWTWRKRIIALSQKIKAQIKNTEPAKIAVITKRVIERSIPGVKLEKGFDLTTALELSVVFHSKIDEVIGNINAGRILKAAYLLQLARVEQMMNIETKVGMLFPWGYKNIAVLAQIGESLRKLEAGECRIHGRGGEANSNPRGSFPRIPEGDEQAGRYKGPLDGVDPELIRAAGKKVCDLMAAFTADLQSSPGSRAASEAGPEDNLY